MAVQVQEIIDKIKTEGVDAAKAEADRILEKARAEADRILAEATARAEASISEAREKAEREAVSGRAALAQAARDSILLLKREMQRILDSIVLRETKSAMRGEALADILPSVIKSLGKPGTGAELSLPEEDFDKLEARMRSLLTEEIKAGMEIKPNPRLKSGFRISAKDGGAYFDFSGDAVAEFLSQLLNPVLAEIMMEQAGGA